MRLYLLALLGIFLCDEHNVAKQDQCNQLFPQRYSRNYHGVTNLFENALWGGESLEAINGDV